MTTVSAANGVSVHRCGPVKKRVFVADDHGIVLDGLASLLEMTGEFEVVGRCKDGLQVVPLALETRPDAVVLDVAMPGLNGVEVCRELTRQLPNAVVLMVSMHDNDDYVVRALAYGARGYLLKDSAGAHLLEALRTVLAGQLYLDPNIDKGIPHRLHRPQTDRYDTLTPRERQVLQLISESLTNQKIAEKLGLSIKTVITHRSRLMKKLDIHNQTTLVKYFLKRNRDLME